MSNKSTNIAIKVENLSKKYIIRHEKKSGSYETFSDTLIQVSKNIASKIRHPFSGSKLDPQTQEEFWALKNIDFEINQGDKVGIIGRNGAGKSTLLKILSRITEPSSGTIHINGRIASLLEVGTGFHPELTGRENIYLNGAILGMSRKEIKAKFDEIVAFAEVEKFLDTPVKRYSSGMYVRLAFAVAAHLEPEILVVDEVLAVGDVEFQKKCLGKMGEVSKQGRTVLFVSHNMGAINTLCNKGILLSSGKIRAFNSVNKVIDEYMKQSFIAASGYTFISKKPEDPKSKADILEASVLNKDSQASTTLFIDQVAFIRIKWRLKVSVPFLRVGIELIDSSGVVVVSSMDTDATDLQGKPRNPGIFDETMKIPAFLIMPNTYTVRVFAGIPRIERIMEVDDLLSFEIIDNHSHLSHVGNEHRAGYIATPLSWDVKFTNA